MWKILFGERGLVGGKPRTDVPGERQPLVRMSRLVPLPETAQRFLVLLLERVTVYMVEFLKRMAGHGDISIRPFYKKAPNSLE